MANYIVKVYDQSGNPLVGMVVTASGVKNAGGWLTGPTSHEQGSVTTDSTGTAVLFPLPNNPPGANDTWSISGSYQGAGVVAGTFEDQTGNITGDVTKVLTATTIPKSSSGTGLPGSSVYVNPPQVNAPAWAVPAAIAAGAIGVTAVVGVMAYRAHKRRVAAGEPGIAERTARGAVRIAKYAALA